MNVVPTTTAEAGEFLARRRLSAAEVTEITASGGLREACLITTADGEAWFVKRADLGLEREDAVYQLAAEGLLPSGIVRRITPRFEGSPKEPVRVYQGHRACRTWNEMLREVSGFDEVVARQVGIWIGDMHCSPFTGGRIAASRIGPCLIRNYACLGVEDYANSPGFEYDLFLSTSQRVSDRLTALAAVAAATTFLHGDLKVDNLLIGADGIHLVDWEMFCLGDPMFDLGTLVGSVISAWLDHVPSQPDSPLASWFASSTISSARLARCLAALLDGYETATGNRIAADAESKLWSFTGYFLLERGHVSNWVFGRFVLSTRLAMELGERLLVQPELGSGIFLPPRSAR